MQLLDSICSLPTSGTLWLGLESSRHHILVSDDVAALWRMPHYRLHFAHASSIVCWIYDFL